MTILCVIYGCLLRICSVVLLCCSGGSYNSPNLTISCSDMLDVSFLLDYVLFAGIRMFHSVFHIVLRILYWVCSILNKLNFTVYSDTLVIVCIFCSLLKTIIQSVLSSNICYVRDFNVSVALNLIPKDFFVWLDWIGFSEGYIWIFNVWFPFCWLSTIVIFCWKILAMRN